MSLKITMLGTGVGIPQPGRSQASILIENEKRLLLDCGAGTLMRLDQAGLSHEAVDTVVLTHLHLDHVSDLMALANARYLSGLSDLEIYGPEGTDVWFKIMRSAYPNLERMQAAVHELRPMDSFSSSGFEIFAEEAHHSVTALAYRIESGEKVIVYSGDTEPSARVAALAEDADLLVHECSFPEPFDVTNHSTPLRLGSVLRGSRARRIVLTHLYPQARGCEDEMAETVGDLSGVATETGWDLMSLII